MKQTIQIQLFGQIIINGEVKHGLNYYLKITARIGPDWKTI